MNHIANSKPIASRKRGWHALPNAKSPNQGKGSATVSPIRDTKDIARIKGALAGNLRDLSLFVIGIHVGLRGSDLLSLKWPDVLNEEGEVRDRLTVIEKKTRNTRHIALQEKARQILEGWRHHNGRAAAAGGYVWPNTHGAMLTIQRLHQLVNSWCAAAGVKGHFGTHTLRKTYGYHLRKLGYDVDLLMKIFGHSSAAITLRYIGIEQEQIDEANLKLVL